MRLQNKDRLEEKDIKSMVALFHEHELSLIPENEELQERYHPSDLFRRNMEIIIESQKKKFMAHMHRSGGNRGCFGNCTTTDDCKRNRMAGTLA